MKLKSDLWQVTSDNNRNRLRCEKSSPHHSSLITHHSQRGIALVITLILLSVTLVMAIAFLAISNRERKSVATVTDTATARLAAETALAKAESQIIANRFAFPNSPSGGLLVSTNYINPNGFLGGNSSANPTNVNYDNAVNGSDPLQNIANLLFLPRVPVFIVTNQQTKASDFRFYLDLNRNGRFDGNGSQLVISPDSAFPYYDTNGNETANYNPPNLLSNTFVGDPEWVGVLERPDATHGPNNKFVSRYAFIVVPAALDLNYIHNQVFDEPPSSTPSSISVNPGANTTDGFFRNQAVGSWEINLAAFLADLNTNAWGENINTTANFYQYNQPFGANSGHAFDDARALLAYRYANNYNLLASANQLFPFAATTFPFDNIDTYSDGPWQTNMDFSSEFVNPDNTSRPWSGADSTNRFFDLMSDLFNTNNTAVGVSAAQVNANNYFTGRLLSAGTNNSTYDRYTFYRLLAQLGTDSQAESGKMNLNYDNLDTAGNVIPGAETNLINWTALRFFTNAADRMLKLYSAYWFQENPSNYLATYYRINYSWFHDGITNDITGFGLTNVPYFGLTNQIPAFGITNIPVYINGQYAYSPAVNRLLQLAANIYDSTTNKTALLGKDFPSVFRPLFTRVISPVVTNIYISGYTNLYSFLGGNNTVAGSGDDQLAFPITLESLAATNVFVLNLPVNIYNVPWILGAKKGFPNFNEFAMENIFGINRRLNLTRNTNSFTLTGTNQLYMINETVNAGIDFWNSYATNFVGNIYGQVFLNLSMTITNDEGLVQLLPFSSTNGFNVLNWPGSGVNWRSSGNPASASFYPFSWSPYFLSNDVYRTSSAKPDTYGTANITHPGFLLSILVSPNYGITQVFETNQVGFPLPHFGQMTTNQLQVFLLSPNINGYYQVIDYAHFAQVKIRDLNAEIFTDDNNGIWNTNPYKGIIGLPNGVENQILISEGFGPAPEGIPPTEDGGASGWASDPDALTLYHSSSQPLQQASFQAFLNGKNFNATATVKNATGSNILSSVQAPYSPSRYVVDYTAWEANDPLVHDLLSELGYPTTNSGPYFTPLTIPLLTNLDVGQLNKNYRPWGGNPARNNGGFSTTIAEPDVNQYSSWIKDPLTYYSDNWDFPAYKFPTVGWLGRVHRGTPWQTVYLKSTSLDETNWAGWTGDVQPALSSFDPYFDADNSLPAQDRLLFDLFTAAPNDNASRGRLSVNVDGNNSSPNAGLAAWSALLSGMAVVTSTTNSYTIIDPVGAAGASSKFLWQIVTNINAARTNIINVDGTSGNFEHIGSILRASSLSTASPFLVNINTNYINDEVDEWLPQQMMGLLKDDSSPTYVIYCYGQALRPAQNGQLVSGTYSGMVTNYQVMAESAVRAVIQVVNATNQAPHIVIKSYNILPPD